MSTEMPEVPVSVADEEFDPEIHAVDESGNPRFNKDGSYAKKRGRKKGSTAGVTDNVRAMPRKVAKKQTSGTDYRSGIMGMFQLVSLPLSFTSPLDAWAVGVHAPNIAEALNDLARERPEVAGALDRILQVGPYGAIIAAVLPLGVQILTNHSKVPAEAARAMGATPKEALIQAMKDHANEANKAA